MTRLFILLPELDRAHFYVDMPASPRRPTTEIDTDLVLNEARSIIQTARTAGRVEELTQRVVRERIAEKLGIDPATLGKGELKKLIKTTIEEALVRIVDCFQ